MIKGILFDYGGTIDTNGIHWAEVIWQNYQKQQLNIPRAVFAGAYAFGEKSLAIHPIVQHDHNFLQVLRSKITRQFLFLNEHGYIIQESFIELIALDCFETAQSHVASARPVLMRLSEKYPLVMVSNFYGNLQTVLKEFEISELFKTVIESAVVGVRKPDPSIYRLGITALGLNPSECVVIGDSFTKDIAPAHQLGCKTIWINGKGWDEGTSEPDTSWNPDAEISDFKDIPAVLEHLNQA